MFSLREFDEPTDVIIIGVSFGDHILNELPKEEREKLTGLLNYVNEYCLLITDDYSEHYLSINGQKLYCDNDGSLMILTLEEYDLLKPLICEPVEVYLIEDFKGEISFRVLFEGGDSDFEIVVNIEEFDQTKYLFVGSLTFEEDEEELFPIVELIANGEFNGFECNLYDPFEYE